MKFNPITKRVYSDQGQFIKELNCPLNRKWESFRSMNDDRNKYCDNCNQKIIDTANLTDNELVKLIEVRPNTCLKIDLNQKNIQIFTNGNFEHR